MRIAGWWMVPAIILAGCAVSPLSNVPSPSASSPEPTQTIPAAPSIAEPSATPSGLTNQLVAVVTDDLVIRSRPGTGPDSEIYPARLSAPALVYVIDGPEPADGYAWYLVDPLALPCYLDCVESAPQPGWVAAAGTDGERWLATEPANPQCPDATLEAISGTYPPLRLYCFRSNELTLNGVVGVQTPEAPFGWPWKHRIELYEPGYLGPVSECVDVCDVPALTVAFDGDNGWPSALSATRVTGHFDDAKAGDCRLPDPGYDQRIVTHLCRLVFVATRWE
jgi:hypothetical protein